MKNSLFTWDVEEKDIQLCGGSKIGFKKAIVRTDNQTVMNVVNKTYEPLLNREVEQVVESVTQSFGFDDAKVFEINGGRRTIVQVKNKALLQIGKDEVEDYITLINSHDGSCSFSIGFGNKVLSCQNQFYSYKKAGMYRIAHSRTILDTINQTINTINRISEERKLYLEYFRHFSETKLKFPEKSAQQMVMRLRNVDVTKDADYNREQLKQGSNVYDKGIVLYNDILREMGSKGDNVWALFNGVTYNTNHSLKNKDLMEFLNFGAGASLNSEAMQECLVYV